MLESSPSDGYFTSMVAVYAVRYGTLFPSFSLVVIRGWHKMVYYVLTWWTASHSFLCGQGETDVGF